MDEPSGQASPRPELHAASGTTAASTTVASSGKGKGGHISALRSLGLLHELQDYVAACVVTQQQQEKELGKLKAEKREVERVLKTKALRSGDKKAGLQQFQASEISDLPPRLRALFEDNKVLKEQARRYKQRAQDAERQAGSVEQQLLALQVANSKLKAQLHEGALEQDVSEIAQARQQADGFAKALEKLQHAHQVLQHKLDTDGRLHRQALAAAGRDRQQLEAEIQQLKEQLDAKDREARAQALAAKQAQRSLEETKAAAAKTAADVNARVAEAVAAAEARHKLATDAGLHLMLCIIRDPGSQQQQVKQRVAAVPESKASDGVAGGLWADDSSTDVSRHAGISSCYTGSMSREQAVLKLQAGARGYLTRKQLRLQQQQAAESLVLVQAGQQRQVQASSDGAAAQSASNLSSGQIGDQAQADGTAFDIATGTTISSAPSLPMDLPALDLGATVVTSNTQLASGAGAAGAGLQRAKGAGAGAGASARAPGSGRGGGRVVLARPSQPATSSGAALMAAIPSRKPALPVFNRAPPASAPHGRMARQDSGSHASSTRSSKSGPGSTVHDSAAVPGGPQVPEGSKHSTAAELQPVGSVSSSGVIGVEQGGPNRLQQPRSSGSQRSRVGGGRATTAQTASRETQQQEQQQTDRQRRLSLQPRPPPGAQQQQQPGASSSFRKASALLKH